MISRQLKLALVALLFAGPGVFGATPGDLLRRAEEADKHVDYRGIKTVTVAFGGENAVVRMKVVHLKPDRTRTVYFAPALLAGIIVIRDGPDGWRYYPKEDVWEPIGHCGLPCGDAVRREALRNYDIRLVGTERVAGREAYVIHALPRYRGEAAHRMWVDQQCYLVIGMQTETSSGTVLRSSRYVSLQIDPSDIDASLFEVRGKIKPAARKASAPGFKVMKPSYVPDGYRLVATASLCVNGCACSHLQFANGVNTISIFQHKAGKDAPAQKVESKVTNTLTWTRDGMEFTIMGDLPRPELKKIADSTK